MKNQVKEKLKKKDVSIGSWLSLANGTVAEIMTKAGCEWICLDMEHSCIGISDVEELFRTIEANGSVPLVRMPSNDPVLAKRLMDAGCYGIIVPMVNTVEEAKLAVQSIKYPPEGIRGVGLYRAQEFGNKFEEYKNTSNDESLVIVQIEHIDGVNNAEAICSVSGVDGMFIGPYDLSCSLGVSGQLDHPLVEEAREKALSAARKAGIALGTHVVPTDVAEVQKRIEEGYNFIAYSTDAIVLNNHFRDVMNKLR